MKKILPNILILLILLTISGCATAKLHKKIGMDKPEVINSSSTNNSTLAKTKDGKYYVKTNNITENEWLLIAENGTNFYSKLNSFLNLPEYIKKESINIILDNRSGKYPSKRIKASLGYSIILRDENKPIFLNKYSGKSYFENNKKPDECYMHINENKIIKTIIMNEWNKTYENKYPGNSIRIVSLIDENSNIADVTCDTIKAQLSNGEKNYFGAMFVLPQYKDQNKDILNNISYIILPLNILELQRLNVGINLDCNEQKITDIPVNRSEISSWRKYRKARQDRLNKSNLYYIKFSSHPFHKEKLLNTYTTHEIGEITHKFNMPTTLTITKTKSKIKKRPIAMRIIATPATVALDILTSPFQLSYLLLILTLGPG